MITVQGLPATPATSQALAFPFPWWAALAELAPNMKRRMAGNGMPIQAATSTIVYALGRVLNEH
eukprot:11224050-Lingulodinium_polyedra.AAC.1